MSSPKNVLGGPLEICCTSPVTGFYRNGLCQKGPQDFGTHVICAQVTSEFLTFTKSRGNDLSTPNQLSGFPGIKPGDRWCLCAMRWKEAMEAGYAQPVILSATEQSALRYIPLEDLKRFALDAE